jgi:allophanate hydrolase
LVDFALGTDTAGSGRVPAGFNGIVGIKPTFGLISTAGVVPARRSLDCVSIFARDVREGWRVFDCLAGPAATLAEPARFNFVVPRDADLRFFDDKEYERLFGAALDRLEAIGGRRRDIDYAPFREAAATLYSDPGVAERVAAFGDFLRAHPDSVHPIIREVIEPGYNATAVDVYRMQDRLAELRKVVATSLAGVDAMVVPTAPTIYRVADVAAEPIKLNSNLGIYTNFVNPLNLAAIAVPAGFRADGLPFGITLVAPAGHDARIGGIALKFSGS